MKRELKQNLESVLKIGGGGDMAGFIGYKHLGKSL